MSDLTLNGWARITSASDPRLRTIAVPGTQRHILARKEAAPVFAAALSLVNQHVISLDGGKAWIGCWNDRPARAASGWSNHAGGTAVDFRWDVWTAAHHQFATGAQIQAMHRILDVFKTSRGKRVLGWGGDWGPGYTDDMHLEVGQYWEPGVGSPVTAVDLADVMRRLRINNNGVIGASVPAITAPVKPVPRVVPFPGAFHLGAVGPYVTAMQRGLVKAGYHLVVDGHYGPQTKAAVVDYQRRHRLGPADGIVGPQTYKALATA